MSTESIGVVAGSRVRVGLVVAFAALGEAEEQAARLAWDCAARSAVHWEPAFAAFGLEPVTAKAQGADILVYLGESSRFQGVAGVASESRPVVFVKSTVEELLIRPPGGAPRYRMCTGVKGIARALASVAPIAPSVHWEGLPWPEAVAGLTHLDEAEQTYVDTSIAAFREAAEERGIPWAGDLLPGQESFSVFLTMHDPAAALLAETALSLWPRATVLAADGMVSTRAPSGAPWPERMLRVRHWSTGSRSESNEGFLRAIGQRPVPDFDSAGMLFGTMYYLDGAFGAGGRPAGLETAGRHPGPLGPMEMRATGQPQPERIIVFRGEESSIVTVG